MKSELAQGLPRAGRPPAVARGALVRAILLSLICAGAALVWSASQARADPLQNLGTALTGDLTHTVNSVTSPIATHAQPDRAAASNSDVKDLTNSLGAVVTSTGRTTNSVASTLDGTTKIVNSVDHPDRLGPSIGGEVKQATTTVATGTDIVRASGGVVSSTGRTVSRLGGDRSGPAGAVLGGVGDTVSNAGRTIDGVGKTTGTVTKTVGNKASATLTATIDHTVGKTVTKVATTVSGAQDTTAGARVGSTSRTPVTATRATVPATVAPTTSPKHSHPAATSRQSAEDPGNGIADAATHLRQTQPQRVSVAPDRTVGSVADAASADGSAAGHVPLILIRHDGSGIAAARHHSSTAPAESSQVPVLTGWSIIGTGGGTPAPIPGQLPAPSAALAAPSGVAGSWHDLAVLPSAIGGLSGALLAAHGSAPGSEPAAAYDPGFSPD